MMSMVLNASALWIVASLLFGLLLRLLRNQISPARFELIELARWVGIPYLALLIGHLSPRLLGLTDQNWRTTFGVGMGFCFGLLVLVAIAKVTNNEGASNRLQHGLPAVPEGAGPLLINPSRWIWSAIKASSHEFHWTFLRAGVWEVLLQSQAAFEVPAYTAIWVAGALSFTEIAIHQRGRSQWIEQFATLLLTSVLFFFTRNFYLCCLLHVGMALIMPSMITTTTHNGATSADRDEMKQLVNLR